MHETLSQDKKKKQKMGPGVMKLKSAAGRSLELRNPRPVWPDSKNLIQNKKLRNNLFVLAAMFSIVIMKKKHCFISHS